MTRLADLIPGLLVLALALWVAFISFTAQPAEGFVFPRLISVVFVSLAVLSLGLSLRNQTAAQAPISWDEVRNFAPGLIIAAVLVFWLAKGLGFYTASALVTFTLVSVYDPASHASWQAWIKRILVTAGFIAVMYLLFALVLSVFTPKEVLFR